MSLFNIKIKEIKKKLKIKNKIKFPEPIKIMLIV